MINITCALKYTALHANAQTHTFREKVSKRGRRLTDRRLERLMAKFKWSQRTDRNPMERDTVWCEPVHHNHNHKQPRILLGSINARTELLLTLLHLFTRAQNRKSHRTDWQYKWNNEKSLAFPWEEHVLPFHWSQTKLKTFHRPSYLILGGNIWLWSNPGKTAGVSWWCAERSLPIHSGWRQAWRTTESTSTQHWKEGEQKSNCVRCWMYSCTALEFPQG